MTGCAVEVRPPADRHEAVAHWLVARTGEAIEERDDGALVAFLPSMDELALLQADLQETFGRDLQVTGRPLELVDWSERWREGLGPRRFGRLLVAPSWSPIESVPGVAAVLVLDPEMAFGSGEHGSTRGALSLLETHLSAGMTMLDLGSGSGILAIAAVLLGARVAIGVEVDDEAIPVAVRNAERNGVAEQVRFVEGDAAVLAPLLGPVDLVVSNILRTVNVTLLPAIHTALHLGGLAIFSGMEVPEAPLFRAPLASAGFEVVAEVVDEGWWSVAARRG